MKRTLALLALLLSLPAYGEDLAEGVAAGRWLATVGASVRDSALAMTGKLSVRLDAPSQAAAGVRRPLVPAADLRGKEALVFTTLGLTFAESGFLPLQPIVVLRCPGDGYVRYDRRSQVGVENVVWRANKVPLPGGGDGNWLRRENGRCGDLRAVEAVDLYFRAPTDGGAYRVYVDGLEFTAKAADGPLVLKILGVVYDPVIEARGGGRLHEVYDGVDPARMLEGAAEKMRENSQGTVDFQLIGIDVLDRWPRQADGFRYTDATFDAAFTARKPVSSATFDYRAFFAENNLEERVNRGEVDEVWLATGNTDFFRTWESNMVGPGAYYMNSQPTTGVPINRAIAVMGFNYQYGDLGENVGHGYGHRIEDVMTRIYGVWDRNNPARNTWSAFAAIDQDAPGRGAVGNIHFPVNGQTDYDYANPRFVLSTADDWLTYPRLTGIRRPISSDAWRRGGDPHVEYLDWFYARLPHAPGRAPDGKLASWWPYIVQLDRYKNGDQGQ